MKFIELIIPFAGYLMLTQCSMLDSKNDDFFGGSYNEQLV